jgi:hypothetical protein
VKDVGKDLALATPGIGVAATGIMGFPWSQLSYMLAAIYTFLLICKFVWDRVKGWQGKRRA